MRTGIKLEPPVGERDHVSGRLDAPIVLVEYGDYECSHCRQAQPVVQALRERLGERLGYVFRYLPLTDVHPHALLAAQAAEAAAEQGKFWEMHEFLFEHQDALDKDSLVGYAAELGLDVERFRRDLREEIYADRVREDYDSAVASGVTGTPSFFINGARYEGAWDLESLAAEIEKPVNVQVRQLFQQFTQLQASGGILLLIATVVALVWANSPWAESYAALWQTKLAITLGGLRLEESLLHWISDGLMVLFFFVVGLEIKREILVGELSRLKHAILPVTAALGGIIFPAAIYLFFNAGAESSAGWGVPVATDIAFTLGILTALGDRVPLSLKVFVAALAIADDLGGVLVIALFYTAEISLGWLAGGAGVFLVLLALNQFNVRSPLPYALAGIGLWFAFLESGVHPTIAGVLLALTVPAQTQVGTQAFLAQCIAVLGEFAPNAPNRDEIIANRQQAAVQTLESIAERIQTPSQRLERAVAPWTTYLILPIFALANAGVAVTAEIGAALTSPIFFGIAGGLLVGKPLGIVLFSWLAVRLGFAELPSGVRWRQIVGASLLAGIGFTIALFIAEIAFANAALLATAKLSILIASVVAAILGTILLLQIKITKKKL